MIFLDDIEDRPVIVWKNEDIDEERHSSYRATLRVGRQRHTSTRHPVQ